MDKDALISKLYDDMNSLNALSNMLLLDGSIGSYDILESIRMDLSKVIDILSEVRR